MLDAADHAANIFPVYRVYVQQQKRAWETRELFAYA